MNKTIHIGTRGSRLAVTQTSWVIDQLKEKFPDSQFEMTIIVTKGDQMTSIPLDKIGDKGLFISEIEAQLGLGKIDFAVHSLKDMPSNMDARFELSKVPIREDARDVLILKEGFDNYLTLPQGARIGTGSKRRLFQLQAIRPDIIAVPIRGNVETRIQKLDEEGLDGVILAAAGLHRLGLSDRISQYLPVEVMIPAPAQGALGLQYRSGDAHIGNMLQAIADEAADLCIRAERSFLKYIEGSCHIPIGCYVTQSGDALLLQSIYGDANGKALYRQTLSGPATNPEALGYQAAMVTLKDTYQDCRVSLVGAGPGDPGLITQKALERLRACDAVVYDRLASPHLLNEVPESAHRLYVGKASSDHVMTQDEINRQLVRLSGQYKRIVRLKGGDPYVFGRGGEEALVLESHGIPYEVIPGVTSAIAGLAYAGIPITHRGIASSFHVFTGHHQMEAQGLDYQIIAHLEGTLVFLMSLSSYKQICRELVDHGKSGTTPVAVVSNATTGLQRVNCATLETVEQISDLPSPAFLIVGEVVSLRDKLNWFEKMPLFGKRIIVTRTTQQSSHFSQKLREMGAQAYELPTIAREAVIDPSCAETLRHLPLYTQIWFTSEFAVIQFFQRLKQAGLDARALSGAKILSIGSVTTKALNSHGIHPDFEPSPYTQEGIVAKMSDVLTPDDHVLLPTAENARTFLFETIKDICAVTKLTLYRTVPGLDASHMKEILESADMITFTSASSVQAFDAERRAMHMALPAHLKCVSIGPITTQALLDCGYDVDITAPVHTIDGMIKALIDMEVTSSEKI